MMLMLSCLCTKNWILIYRRCLVWVDKYFYGLLLAFPPCENYVPRKLLTVKKKTMSKHFIHVVLDFFFMVFGPIRTIVETRIEYMITREKTCYTKSGILPLVSFSWLRAWNLQWDSAQIGPNLIYKLRIQQFR